ncbi:MAG: dihydroorotate dehydrogenase electron transfer subunit [Desulfobacteraceae bacterium]|nr:MAG: dihydroorotate dehydrogenase electron transfer subunit [Desulfobacteraceae bacterium]
MQTESDMYQDTVRILWNHQIGPGYFQMGVTCRPKYAASVPGQFVMLKLPDQITPLLRRPFSIHGLLSSSGRVFGLEILYKVVGEGTRKFSRCREGETLDLIGPLGNGFTVSGSERRIFMAAGGIGVAPMRFLAEFLTEKGFDPSAVTLFLGGRSRGDLLCKEAFADLGISVFTTTDDGSEGDRCFVTHPLAAAVRQSPPDRLYACGPSDMLRCVIDLAEARAVPCEISLESAMACGVGACLGCAVANRRADGSYFHACIDGPVFDSKSIAL